MNTVVTGANGLLGQHLVQQLLLRGHRVWALARGNERIDFSAYPTYTYRSLDIRDKAAVQQFFLNGSPIDTLIHAAALTQVDYCEQHQEEAYEVNVTATGNLIQCAKYHCRNVLYVSTDFVFDGETGNYREEDQPAPINYYGVTKMMAEELVRDAGIPWSIARTCLVFGHTIAGTRANIISWVKENLEKGQSIKVVCDQVRTPTYIDDLVNGIILMAESRAESVYHISGKDIITPYDMACATADFFHLDKQLLEKVDGTVFTQPARRPLRTGFDITKARTILGYEPLRFEEGIAAMYSQ